MTNKQKINSSNRNLNKLFLDIKLKKQYLQKLNKNIILLHYIKEKNYKSLCLSMPSSKHNVKKTQEDFLVSYIIDITFSRKNAFLHVMDFSGNVKFFYSAGSLGYLGKKRISFTVIKHFYKILCSNIEFLTNQPTVLNLKNAGGLRKFIIKLLKKKFFIKVVRSFVLYPYNGCRRKKIRRKKIRKKK